MTASNHGEQTMSSDLESDLVNLTRLIRELVQQLQRPAVTTEDQLWTSQDIATYLKLSAYTVERRVVTQPSFPKSVQPCSTGVKAAKRWFAAEVIAWLRLHRARQPVARRSRK